MNRLIVSKVFAILCLAQALGCAADESPVVTPIDVVVDPTALGEPRFEFNGKFHDIEVGRCVRDCDAREFCGFEVAAIVWSAGVGERHDYRADGPRTQVPELAAPVNYGNEPHGADYATTAEALTPGRYYVAAQRYSSCDDGEGCCGQTEQCLDLDEIGCGYFDVSADGSIDPIRSTR